MTTESGKFELAIPCDRQSSFDPQLIAKYPAGLAGNAIPIEGRITAVADVFDALCSERPYKPAWPVEKAFAEIVSCRGRHFDPACVDAFVSCWQQIRALVETAAKSEVTAAA
ncbi:response regulator receiver modulated metal dependent phosphohydrolase [Aurantimonas sp. 22II-16-19i]|nr:response regulator receiver modulated metal dependent phosphohydrolase [Aurantimonas sp. 22II-16-19i]